MAAVDDRGLVDSARHTGETAIVCLYGGQAAAARVLVPSTRRSSPGDWDGFPRSNFIDEHVEAQLRLLNLRPSPVVDDVRFLRRATLQVAGRVPTPAEVRAFVADVDEDKRARRDPNRAPSGPVVRDEPPGTPYAPEES